MKSLVFPIPELKNPFCWEVSWWLPSSGELGALASYRNAAAAAACVFVLVEEDVLVVLDAALVLTDE
eukprot:5938957-Amphidinium_carterae.1